MSPRAFRWTLWLGAVLALPFPFAGVQPAFIPVGRQSMLAALTAAFVWTEGTAGVGPMVLALFLGQAVLWGGVCWVVAYGFSRALGAARPGFRQRVALVLVAILLGVGIVDRFYVTPYSQFSERSSLLEVYR